MSDTATTDIVKHSPGPWQTWAADGYWVVIDKDDEKVADTQDLLKPLTEQTANANLIAAAPLMAALLVRWSHQGVFPDLTRETRDVLKDAGVQW